MHVADRNRPQLSPQEGWISDGRHVLYFRPTRSDSWCQQLEITVGELLADQAVPLLKKWLGISPEEALNSSSEARSAMIIGNRWRLCGIRPS